MLTSGGKAFQTQKTLNSYSSGRDRQVTSVQLLKPEYEWIAKQQFTHAKDMLLN